MYGESEPRNKLPIFAMVVAMIFGAGSIWLWTHGLQIAIHGLPSKTANTASIFDVANMNIENTLSNSSHFIRNAVPAIKLPSPTVTIMIGGDVMLDRLMRRIGTKKGYDYLFSSVAPLFKTADIVIANLEGPITINPSKTLLPNGTMTSSLLFTFAPSSAKALSNAGITAISLANNHEDNFGAAGVTETKKWLKGAGVKWFGSPWNVASTTFATTTKGMRIAFVGYESFQPGIDTVLAEIKRLSTAGYFVIVMPHWGEEYTTTPSVKMRSQARSFVTAGAKAIIGSHPHVMMSDEMIAGVPVYYSIGNLIFDQYFSEAVMNGEIVSLTLVNGPAGPSLDKIITYGTRLDRTKGVVLK